MTTTSVRDLSPACQDYLRSIYVLAGTDERVSISALAERMAVTAPSATAMSKRLASMGLVERVPYRGLSLTDEGRHVALELLRHHRLIERYLADTLGLPLDAVHDEADRLEHALSEELEARIDERLGYPTLDPHGDPIPDRELRLAPSAVLRTILELRPGEQATVAAVPDSDPALLRYLGDLGLVPAGEVTAVAAAPFDGPVTLDTVSGRHAISRELAGRIGVSEPAPR
jgi:DtxR family transcriptional regulator, Mn-dependent transcriptional regulator